MSDVAYSPAACSFACCSRILVMSSCLVSVFRLEEDFSCKVGRSGGNLKNHKTKKLVDLGVFRNFLCDIKRFTTGGRL